MNKLVKVLAASALVATALVGCGKKDEGGAAANDGAKYAKAGLGVVTSMGHSDAKEVNTTFAGIGLDKEGKIQWIKIDVAQGTPGNKDAERTQTKLERKDDYAMKGASGIGKEWYEQIAAFEEQCKGKTPEEVAKFAVNEEGKATDADVKAGCTMAITDFQKAVEAASKNAQAVEANDLGLAAVMAYEKDYGGNENTYLSTTMALVAKDGDKIVWADLDVAKIKNDGSSLKTKTELKGDYNMKQASGIQKEWFEQMAAYEGWVKGKTLKDLTDIATGKTAEGSPAAKEGSDLAAGCTMAINEFNAAIEKAMK